MDPRAIPQAAMHTTMSEIIDPRPYRRLIDGYIRTPFDARRIPADFPSPWDIRAVPLNPDSTTYNLPPDPDMPGCMTGAISKVCRVHTCRAVSRSVAADNRHYAVVHMDDTSMILDDSDAAWELVNRGHHRRVPRKVTFAGVVSELAAATE